MQKMVGGKFFQIFLLALFVASFPFGSQAQEKKTIEWLIWNLPPEFVQSGPWKDQGYADKFLKFFKDNLPEYEHSTIVVNVPRWSREAFRDNRCTAHLWGGFFTDRLLYSKPYSFTPPQVAVFHKRHQERIGPEGTVVSIEELLKQSDLTLMILRLNFNDEAGQSRYPVLHPYLEPYVGKPNLVELAGLENVVDLRLLSRERADFTVGYPSTITTQRRLKNLGDDFIAYHFKEHNLYKNVHVACNKNTHGREVIKKINALITKDALMEFLSYHEEWNNHDAEFRQTTIDYFINGKDLKNVLK